MKRLHLLAVVLGILAVAVLAYGQTGLGSIGGVVRDPSGAVIPAAKITVTNTATGIKTEVASNAEGYYQVLRLIPGPYSLEAEASGFKKLERPGIEVRVADRLTIDVNLEVGTATEAITVEAEVPLLRTQDAQTGEVITHKFIENLPQLNRDPLRLLVLSGNVQGDGSRAGNGSDTRINGGRTSGIEYYVDGITAGSGGAHRVTELTPAMDAVAEFKVITNGIAAEYGRISGGAVEMVTRSGTNDYHGQAFEYLKNDHLNANSWQQNYLGGKKTVFRNNDFGFTIGGPVWIPKIYNGKDRTFFFVNYEGVRFSQAGALQVASVPTEAERNGDLTGTMFDNIPAFIFDPNGPQIFRSDLNKWERTLPMGGDGKHVPASQIHPVSAALLSKLPMPNKAPTPGTSSQNNFVAPQSTKSSSDFLAARLDHNFTQNHRVFARFTAGSRDFGQTRWRGDLFTAPENHLKEGRFGTVNYDWNVRPTLLFNARTGVMHNPYSAGNLLPADFDNSFIPFEPITKGLLGDKGMVSIVATFMGWTGFADPPSLQQAVNTTYHAGVSMTKLLNKHTVKFGYEHRRYYDNYGSGFDGNFWFQQNPVARYAEDNDWNSLAFANSIGAYLVGINDWARVIGPHSEALNFNYHAAFVQDDFKVTPKLTVNVGVRWDMETPTTERNDKTYFWDWDAPPAFSINPGYDFASALGEAGLPTDLPTPTWVDGFQNGAIRIANTPEFPGRKGQKTNPHQFAPRIGVAYQINSKTVLRSHFGMMYLSSSGNPNALISASANISTADKADAGWHASNDGLRHLISNWDTPFRPADVTKYVRDNQLANYQSTGSIGPGAWSRESNMPYELTWNLGIQRELPNRFLVEANYSANRGVKLLAPDLVSRFPKAFFRSDDPDWVRAMKTMVASPTAGQTREDAVVGTKQALAFLYYPMPYYGPVNVFGTNMGSSRYHSLNLRVERRFSQGLAFLLNYSLSQQLDDVGGPEAGNGAITGFAYGSKDVQSVDSINSAWGLSAYDEKHRLITTYSYELPFGKGKRWLGSPQGDMGKTVLDYVVGGWEISGFTAWRSGRPVILVAGNTNVNNDTRVERTFGSYASSDHNLNHPSFSDNNQVLRSSNDPRPEGMTRRFDPSKVLDAKTFTYGTLPPILDNIRHPSFTQTDVSLMKKFRLWSEASFLQIRLEAENAFNQRGFGQYNTTIGTPDFGLITTAGNVERRMQVSARIVF